MVGFVLGGTNGYYMIFQKMQFSLIKIVPFLRVQFFAPVKSSERNIWSILVCFLHPHNFADQCISFALHDEEVICMFELNYYF